MIAIVTGRHNVEDIIKKARLDAMIYHLISICFKMPDITLKEERSIEALSELLALVNDEASNYSRKMMVEINAQDNLNHLKLEYTRLFIGPKILLAPPYGSLYLEEQGQLMGVSTFDAMKMYTQAGLEKAKDFKEPPDHIRIELEFLQYLNSKVVEYYEEGDIDSGERYLSLQDDFLKKHLGSWIRPFTNNIIINTKSEFYKNLALLTQSIL